MYRFALYMFCGVFSSVFVSCASIVCLVCCGMCVELLRNVAKRVQYCENVGELMSSDFCSNGMGWGDLGRGGGLTSIGHRNERGEERGADIYRTSIREGLGIYWRSIREGPEIEWTSNGDQTGRKSKKDRFGIDLGSIRDRSEIDSGSI